MERKDRRVEGAPVEVGGGKQRGRHHFLKHTLL